MLSNYENFKQSINMYIQDNVNNNKLDIGMAYYILKDVFKELENLYYASLNNEAMQQAQKQNIEENNEEMGKAEE